MLAKNGVYQGGLSIIELLVGLVVSLIVLGMILSIYLTTLTTSGSTLKSSRLNQEVAAIMGIMANDIRRAGYASADGPDWDDPSGTTFKDLPNYLEPSSNPFNLPGVTALDVRDTATDASQTGAGGDKIGDCIVYGYDASMGDVDADDFVQDDDEFFGFRYNAADKSISMRRAFVWAGVVNPTPNSCATTADSLWDQLNDERSIEITRLEFDMTGSSCVNSAEPDDVGADDENEADCYLTPPAPAAGVTIRTVERRDVLITIEARLKDDRAVQTQMVQRVSVRNDLVRSYTGP